MYLKSVHSPMLKIALIALILLTSCTSKAYQPYPVASGIRLNSEETNKKIAELNSQAVPQTAKFLLNVSLRYGEEFNSFRQGLVYESPANFRVETYPIQAGWASNYFITDGQEYLYYDSQVKTEKIGEYRDDLFEEYYNIPVTLNEILSLLNGRTPQKWVNNSDVQVYLNGTAQSFSTADQQYFWNLNEANLLQDFVIYQKGRKKVILKGKVLSYQEREQHNLPNIIQLEVPAHDVKITIRMSQAQINQPIAENLFVFN